MAVLLFDFFGTLVDYSPSRTEQGYHRTHSFVRGLGIDLGYAELLARWSDVSARFDAASEVDDHEFSMLELGLAFLREVGHPAARDTAQHLVTTYVEEWNQGVHPIAGVPELIVALSVEHRLAIVTNTHDPLLVPAHLEAMHIASCFETVTASVEVGWRKPHPTIYRTALEALAADPADTVFVGDSKVPDYDGPRAAGMRALLIDPGHHHDIPPTDRLESVLDLPDRLMAR